jgi:site-specific DNA-methyltransferase (adenine-specific)
VSSEAAAELLNISRRSVISARRIRDQGAPALVAAVDEGLVAVSDAAAVTGLAAADQQALVDAVRAGAHRTLRRAAVARRREAREMPTGELSAVCDRFRLFVADVGSVIEQIEPGSIDCIVCDPPYPREFLPVYGDLARTAAQVLKPGGSCLVMAGQSYLPEILAAMTPHLRYHWTVAYLTPGGQSAQLWERRVNTFWKPVLWLIKDSEGAGHAGDWVSDVARSATNDNDKRFHHWGQSESGMADLVRRFTRAGDTVFDPFLGGGTTGVAALASNRLFVGSDVNAEAVARSRRRLLDAIREIADAG